MIDKESISLTFQKAKDELLDTITDEKFKQYIVDELIFNDVENNKIDISIKNIFIAKQFTNTYLSQLQNIFNKLSQTDVYIITLDAKSDKNEISHEQKHFVHDSNQTFNNYIEGVFNDGAITCAKKMVDSEKWDLLIVYGPNGSGKTHLLNATANYYLLKDPNKKIALINSTDFCQNIFNNIKSTEHIQNIKNEILKSSFIFFDDLQYIQNKPSICEILFEILTISKLRKIPVILTSNINVEKIKNLTSSLSTLISSCMNCTIKQPSVKDKKNIIIAALDNEEEKFQLTDDALDYLAIRNIDGNVNKLIRLVDKIAIYTSKTSTNVIGKTEVEKICNAIKIETHSHESTIEIIAKYFNIDKDALVSPDRRKEIVYVRDICMYLIKKKFSLTLKKIGSLFSNMSHSSVKTGIERIEKKIKGNPSTVQQLDNINKLL